MNNLLSDLMTDLSTEVNQHMLRQLATGKRLGYSPFNKRKGRVK